MFLLKTPQFFEDSSVDDQLNRKSWWCFTKILMMTMFLLKTPQKCLFQKCLFRNAFVEMPNPIYPIMDECLFQNLWCFQKLWIRHLLKKPMVTANTKILMMTKTSSIWGISYLSYYGYSQETMTMFLLKTPQMFLLFKMMIFPFSTVLCESCFSHMNQIKNAFRTRLLPENLENLMFLTLNKDKEVDFENSAMKMARKFNFWSVVNDVFNYGFNPMN